MAGELKDRLNAALEGASVTELRFVTRSA